MSVETIKIPPSTEVLGRRSKVLNPNELGHVAQEVVNDWAEPLVALSVDADSIVRGAESIKRMDLEISTTFNDRSCDETAL